jgi:catechol 2,3-dioxygenase-like lactoylglutathione lyase family enzyme
MPLKTSGLDHIVISVTDPKRSGAFYRDILGFDVHFLPADYANPIFAGTCYFDVGGIELFFVHHPATPAGDRFDETRVGLDHLSFRAPDEAALHVLVGVLQAAGIATNGVEVFMPAGKKYVMFHDPDNIQVEYWLNG